MNLPPYSEEQYNVINSLVNNNVVVDSVAGSGKTTCNLHIATKYSDKNILLLTYNAKLKIETREKSQSLGLKNMTVHTYHSFCVKYYNTKEAGKMGSDWIIWTKKSKCYCPKCDRIIKLKRIITKLKSHD